MNIIKNKQDKSICKKDFPLLSVVVSCKAVETILLHQLKFLKKQNLDSHLWQAVFLFKESVLKSSLSLVRQYFPRAKIFFLEEGKPLYEMRNLAFEHLESPYLYFIDEDVMLEKTDHLSSVIALHQRYPETTVLGGSYFNHPKSTFWGNCYNWIVRLWVKAHKTEKGQDLFPAGNLSLKNNKNFKARFYSPYGFGAEEIYFLKALHREGFKSHVHSALEALHWAEHSFKDFVQRAWLHGRNLPKLSAGSKSLFFKEPAGFFIKTSALLYLLLVRFSFRWKEFKVFVSKMS